MPAPFTLTWPHASGTDLVLALCVGGYVIDLADGERYVDGTWGVVLHNWTRDGERPSIPCADRDEAIAVIRALVGQRLGVEIPAPESEVT